MRCIILALLLGSSLGCVAQQKLLTAPEPSWVQQYDYQENPDSSGTYSGYSYRLVSFQRHLELKEFYHRYVIKVVSSEGLSSASSINESFDPSYEKLIFHTLKIKRNGQTIDKLDARKFEIIRREEDLSRAIYDKALNAVYNLPDVRVGDIVEYSFTKKGFNPVFGEHRFGKMYFQYGMPVGKFAHRLITDATRELVFKSNSNAEPFSESVSGKLKYYERVVENIPAVLEDDALPSWYDPYRFIQYSDFRSWNDVKKWALPLYRHEATTKAALQTVIDRIIKENETKEGQIKACIRLAQGDVRYLSFSDGIHGYKPHSPVAVYEQKYGDCKDKSFLLSYLLNAIGIESYPALVSTDNGYVLNDALPNPWAFNHCIVQFIANDSTYWIDPTMNAQTGPLKSYYFPSYHQALVVNAKTNHLDSIAFGGKGSRIEVLEEYSMDHMRGDGNLKVKTQYFGDEADEMRSYLLRNTKEEVNKNFVNFYSKEYAKIKLDGDVKFTDNQDQNIIETTELYVIPDFWSSDKEKGETCSVYPRVLSTYLKKPETVQRTMPLRITHPTEIHQTIKIYLPDEITSTDYSNTIESAGFFYRGSNFYNNKVVTLRYTYTAKKPFVSVAEAAEHIEKIDAAFSDLGYNITISPEDKSWSAQYGGIIMIILVVGLVVFISRRSRR